MLHRILLTTPPPCIIAPSVAENQTERLLDLAMPTGVMGTSLASRYALPAGAAMLGAKGIADITGGLYDMASEEPILR